MVKKKTVNHIVMTALLAVTFAYAENVATDTTFEAVLKNKMLVTEYRVAYEVETGFDKTRFWDSCSAAIKKISDSVIRSEIDRDQIFYPQTTSEFSKAIFLYRTKNILFSKYFATWIFFTADSTKCCIWTFKTTPTGLFLKGVKGKSTKLGNYLIEKGVLKKMIFKRAI